ncbi:MAG TPA: hypothetical protein VFD45_00330 [Patescibacteria group bacterium]|nr:hypothetical protein [Patescibacteria group bacterium]
MSSSPETKRRTHPPKLYRMITNPNIPGINALRRRTDIIDYFGTGLGEVIKGFAIASRRDLEGADTAETILAEKLWKARENGDEILVFQAGITVNRLLNDPLAPIYTGGCAKI